MTIEEYEADLIEFGTDTRFPELIRIPALNDDIGPTHHEWSYVLHTAWAARVLAETRPVLHIDISSYIYFVSIVSAFIPIKYYEFKKPELPLSNIVCNQLDLMSPNSIPHQSVKSLSCMHTIEHIGLGRYGDSIDPNGDRNAADRLISMLAPGGDLLIVVPVGKPKLEFNSARTYSYEQVIDLFYHLEVKEFSLIPDTYRETSALIRNAPSSMVQDQINGTGCFWFKKL